MIVPTKIIDHIKPILDGGDEWDRDNLQGLCESCHNRKTAIETNKRK
jgi:5-methylcytosine-specific restriction protein A